MCLNYAAGISAVVESLGIPLGEIKYGDSIAFIAKKGFPSEAKHRISYRYRGPMQLTANIIRFPSDYGKC